MHVFGPLTLLMVLLGSSWPLLGRFGPKMSPQNSPKSAPKSVQQIVHETTPEITKTNANVRLQSGPQNGPKTISRQPLHPMLAHLGSSWALLGSLGTLFGHFVAFLDRLAPSQGCLATLLGHLGAILLCFSWL